MPSSEERLQILMPRALKKALEDLAKRSGLSVGAYIRRLIEADLRRPEEPGSGAPFPFGESPIDTGRKRGSVDHDRPGS